MDNTIKIEIDLKNTPQRYPYITNDRDNYTSDLSYRSYMNLFKSRKSGGVDTLLEDLAGGFVKSVFNAVNQVIFDRQMKKIADNALRELTKNNPAMIWTDD
jgi:hypothetical protein